MSRLEKVPQRAATVAGRLGGRGRERRLRERLLRLHPPAADPRTVTVVILTRDGRDRLARLLPALRRTLRMGVEVLVVDNGSDRPTRRFLAAQPDIEVLWAPDNRSFSAANNLAAERAKGDVLCLLNDDIQPIGPRWLERMVAALTDGVTVVGAQLVYPRLPLLAGSRRDLTVQHRGIAFVPVLGGIPRAVNLKGGQAVVDGRAPEVAAVAGACLAVERRVYRDLGGLDEGYVYGAEDVDLCWRARRAGGRVAVVHDAVLLHHEGATRHTDDPAERRRRQAANWQRFATRHGEDVVRAVTVDRLTARAALSRVRYRAAVIAAPGARPQVAAEALRQAVAPLGWDLRDGTVASGRTAAPGGEAPEGGARGGRFVPGDVDLVMVVGEGLEPGGLRQPGRALGLWLPDGGGGLGPAADRWDVVVTARDPGVALAGARDALVAGLDASDTSDASDRKTGGRLRT